MDYNYLMRKAAFISFSILAIIGIAAFVFFKTYTSQRITDIPAAGEPTEASLEEAPALSTFVTGRQVIWSMDFLPDGRMIFTERSGRVNLVEQNGSVSQIASVSVHASGESGLHGVAVDPDFGQNRFVYLYYTYRGGGNNTLNRVSRFVFENSQLTGERVIVDGIPGASTHDGGRLKFGADGYLYISTGDAQEPSRSQDRDSLAGKILRVTRDGSPAPGNPFGTRIYSYGHRNPQGLAWDVADRLWATEHGPSANDELNLIEPGANYGWPEFRGDATARGMRAAVLHSGTNTWAPAGAQFLGGSIFFGGLRGSALYEYTIDTQVLTEHLKGRLGRIRDVVLGPDGFLYIATSNRDGRGIPESDDDRILKINPSKLSEI